MMRKTGRETLYWQIWKVGRKLFILSGVLGVIGELEEIPLSLFNNSKKMMKNLSNEKANQGYERFDDRSLTKISVQYRYDDEEQFDEIEEMSIFVGILLDEAVHRTGNGEFNSLQIESGVAVNSFLVVNIEIALKTIVKELTNNNLIAGAEIFFIDQDGASVLIYPINS